MARAGAGGASARKRAVRIDPRRRLVRLERLRSPRSWPDGRPPRFRSIPRRWPLLLAAVAAALDGQSAGRARLHVGRARVPLGNVSLGLAIAYAGLAVGWLALMWGDARRGLLFGTGMFWGRSRLLGIVPLAVCTRPAGAARGARARRGLAGGPRRGHPRVAQCRSAAKPPGLGIAGSEHPVGVFDSLWQWILAHPELGIEAVILGVAAGALPHVTRRADLSIAAFAALSWRQRCSPPRRPSALPLVFTGWSRILALTVQSRRFRSESRNDAVSARLATDTCGFPR